MKKLPLVICLVLAASVSAKADDNALIKLNEPTDIVFIGNPAVGTGSFTKFIGDGWYDFKFTNGEVWKVNANTISMMRKARD